MKNKKLIIDILMLIILILLYNLRFTGILVHEILGIAIWVLFIIHLLLNIKWIKQITKNIFSDKMKKKTKYLYLVDLLIFIDYIVVTISGILISKYIFTFNYNLYNLHKISSYIGAGLIVLHLIIHIDFFSKQFTKMFNDKDNKKGTFMTILLILISTILFTNNLFIDKLKNMFSSNDIENSTTIDTNNDSDNNTSRVTETDEDKPSLTDYLSKLFCTGCHRRCPLSNPQCGVGERQASAAEEDYNELYNQ